MFRVTPTSRWVLAVAGMLWIALVAAAAWVGSVDGVVPEVLATVLGTAAGLAFAATGLAAYGERRRGRRQREEFEHVVVSHLRVACRTTNRLANILVDLTAVGSETLANEHLRDRLGQLLSPTTHAVAPGVARVLRDVVCGGSWMDPSEERLVKVLDRAHVVAQLAPEDPDREHNLFLLRLYQLVTHSHRDTSVGHHRRDVAMTEAIRHGSASVNASVDLLLAQLELLLDYQFEALRNLEGCRVELRANVDLWRMELLEVEGGRSTWLRSATADILVTVTGLAAALSVSSRELFDHMAAQGFSGAVNSFVGRIDLVSPELQQRNFETIDQDLAYLWDHENLPPLT